MISHSSAPLCTELHLSIPYCTSQYRTAPPTPCSTHAAVHTLHCTVPPTPHHPTLYRTVQRSTTSHCTVPYRTAPPYTVPYSTPHTDTLPYRITLYQCAAPSCTAPSRTAPACSPGSAVPYRTTPYQRTAPACSSGSAGPRCRSRRTRCGRPAGQRCCRGAGRRGTAQTEAAAAERVLVYGGGGKFISLRKFRVPLFVHLVNMEYSDTGFYGVL